MQVWALAKCPFERRTAIPTKTSFPKLSLKQLERLILTSLDDQKAQEIVSINVEGKSDFADRMVIASGTSARHVSSLADRVVDALKKAGYQHIPVEGKETCEWVLVDVGNVVVHLFKPEARAYYHLEKMWTVSVPRLEVAL